jgi:hypothetical protein
VCIVGDQRACLLPLKAHHTHNKPPKTILATTTVILPTTQNMNNSYNMVGLVNCIKCLFFFKFMTRNRFPSSERKTSKLGGAYFMEVWSPRNGRGTARLSFLLA